MDEEKPKTRRTRTQNSTIQKDFSKVIKEVADSLAPPKDLENRFKAAFARGRKEAAEAVYEQAKKDLVQAVLNELKK